MIIMRIIKPRLYLAIIKMMTRTEKRQEQNAPLTDRSGLGWSTWMRDAHAESRAEPSRERRTFTRAAVCDCTCAFYENLFTWWAAPTMTRVIESAPAPGKKEGPRPPPPARRRGDLLRAPLRGGDRENYGNARELAIHSARSLLLFLQIARFVSSRVVLYYILYTRIYRENASISRGTGSMVILFARPPCSICIYIYIYLIFPSYRARVPAPGYATFSRGSPLSRDRIT